MQVLVLAVALQSFANISPMRRFALAGIAVLALTAAAVALTRFLILPVRRESRRCPTCESIRIRPSWPRLSDRFTPWLRALRCEACGERFHVMKHREMIVGRASARVEL